MKIPVFLSSPTALSKKQKQSRKQIIHELRRLNLVPNSLGRSDYPTDLPLREVLVMAQHCSGGVILGFEQFLAARGKWKRGTKEQKIQKQAKPFPTPWNHIEAGILFTLDIPLIVFCEEGVSGGIFDAGVSDLFVHKMPSNKLTLNAREELSTVMVKWSAEVHNHYYNK